MLSDVHVYKQSHGYHRKISWCSGIFRENVVIFRDIPPYSVIFRHIPWYSVIFRHSGFSQRPVFTHHLAKHSLFHIEKKIWISSKLFRICSESYNLLRVMWVKSSCIQALSCRKFRLNTAQSKNIYFEFFKISFLLARTRHVCKHWEYFDL